LAVAGVISNVDGFAIAKHIKKTSPVRNTKAIRGVFNS
jgi:hypothetical protein